MSYQSYMIVLTATLCMIIIFHNNMVQYGGFFNW